MKTGGKRIGAILLAWTMLLVGLLTEVPATAHAAATTYYVDSVNGSDSSNDGKSEAAPWKTIAKVNAAALNPGDQVLFRRGGTWFGTVLKPSASGTAGSPIVYDSYGPPELPLPLISGTTRISSAGWQGPDANGEFYRTGYASGDASKIVLMEDGRRLPGKNGEALLAGPLKGSLAPGEWVWDAATSSVYYKPTSGTPADHTVDITPVSGFAFASNSFSHITVQNIDFYGGYTYVVLIHGSSTNVTIRDSDIHGADRYAARITGSNGNSFIGNRIYDANFYGVYIEGASSNNLVSGNEVYGIGQLATDDGELVGINIGGISSTARPSNNIVENNEVYQIGRDGYKGQNGTSARGMMYSMGILVESSVGNVIRHNEVREVWRSGIGVLTNYTDSRNTLIEGNLLHQTGRANAVDANNSGIYLNHKIGLLNGTRIFNNTIANSRFYSQTNKEGAIALRAYGPALVAGAKTSLSDLQIKNNIFAHNQGNYALYVEIDADVTTTDLVSDYNIFYSAAGGSVGGGLLWRQSGNTAIYDQQHLVGSAAGFYSVDKQQDQHSRVADPQFVSPAAADYRLTEQSPAVDRGTDVGLTADRDGNAIPYGTGPDIGAYESAYTAPPQAPVVQGVANGGIYATVVQATYNEGTATLARNGGTPLPYSSGTPIDQAGTYVLYVTSINGTTTVQFELQFAPITLTGISDGAIYNHTVTPVFPVGTATLQADGGSAEAYQSATPISAEGAYVLTITSYGSQLVTVRFTIDKTAPAIGGVTDGATYAAAVTPTFTEGSGKLFRLTTTTAESTEIVERMETVSFEDGVETIESVQLYETSEETVTVEEVIADPFLSGTAIQQDGTYKLTVTDTAGNVAAATFTVAIPVPALAFGSAGPVHPGETFDLRMGVSQVSGVSGLDLRLRYDKTRLEYVTAVSDRTGTVVDVDHQADAGKLVILVLNQGAQHVMNGDEPAILLRFRVKDGSTAGVSRIEAESATAANGLGQESALLLGGTDVEVTIPVDKTALLQSISQAEALHAAAQGGTAVGQFFPGMLSQWKQELQAAIHAAEAVADLSGATSQQQVNDANQALQAAIAAFESKRITAATGDINGIPGFTIGDISIVAYHYGKTPSSPDWATAQAADVNKDGVVDLIDLAFVASRIFSS